MLYPIELQKIKMKKILIILLFFSSIVSAETNKKSKFDDWTLPFSILAEEQGVPDYVVESDFELPEPFGIQLGEILDKDIILEAEDKRRGKFKYYVTPPNINESFTTYYVITLHNIVYEINAEGYVGDSCKDRLSLYADFLSSKYGGVTKESGEWVFVQANVKRFNSRGVIVPEFGINIYCTATNINIHYRT